MFVFANGIDSNIAYDLESLGVIVKGMRLKDNIEHIEDQCIEQNECRDSDDKDIDKINLDVSAMIAYTSSLTNGHCNYIYKVPVLTQQAEWERVRPVKPILDELFRG